MWRAATASRIGPSAPGRLLPGGATYFATRQIFPDRENEKDAAGFWRSTTPSMTTIAGEWPGRFSVNPSTADVTTSILLGAVKRASIEARLPGVMASSRTQYAAPYFNARVTNRT